ncbi:hypothetical protein ACWD0J_21360 [Streptomyces sp. NPDC003011]
MNQHPLPSRYAFLVSANNPVPVPGPPSTGLPPDTDMAATIRLPGSRSDDVPLARVLSPRSAQRWSREAPLPFWLHGGPDGTPMCSVRPVAPDAYDVHTADGAPLARITRRPARLLPWPRRVRWSAQLGDAPHPVTGKVGTWYSWLVYVLTAPVWFLFALCAMLYSFFDGTADDYTFRHPTRTRWHTPGTGTVLDYRGISDVYRFEPQGLDVRVGYALAVLRTWEREH